MSFSLQVCRLGRHCPITKVLRDGILRVGKTAAVKLAKEPVDEWFTLLGDSTTTNMLKLYAQVSINIIVLLLYDTHQTRRFNKFYSVPLFIISKFLY